MIPATFICQTNTKLVQGRDIYKVPMLNRTTHENMEWDPTLDLHGQPKELTELEQLYLEFCKKAERILRTNLSGPDHPYRIIFDDFSFCIIPRKFPVE